jgi:hypothetical protein
MSTIQRQNIEIEIDRLEAILDGEEVDGCVLGENGLTARYLLSQISLRLSLLGSNV